MLRKMLWAINIKSQSQNDAAARWWVFAVSNCIPPPLKMLIFHLKCWPLYRHNPPSQPQIKMGECEVMLFLSTHLIFTMFDIPIKNCPTNTINCCYCPPPLQIKQRRRCRQFFSVSLFYPSLLIKFFPFNSPIKKLFPHDWD
jgi:hypothetical protein